MNWEEIFTTQRVLVSKLFLKFPTLKKPDWGRITIILVIYFEKDKLESALLVILG